MSSKAILDLIDQCNNVEMQFIGGKPDWVKQPIEGPMQRKELEDLLEKIRTGKWRGRLHVEQTRDRKYYIVRFEHTQDGVQLQGI
ncbi:MAG: hypothetical protein M1497_15920 [Nitrospirae bacterium]|nr:hypothetical protein [Nitrospirota bacterium]